MALDYICYKKRPFRGVFLHKQNAHVSSILKCWLVICKYKDVRDNRCTWLRPIHCSRSQPNPRGGGGSAAAMQPRPCHIIYYKSLIMVQIVILRKWHCITSWAEISEDISRWRRQIWMLSSQPWCINPQHGSKDPWLARMHPTSYQVKYYSRPVESTV